MKNALVIEGSNDSIIQIFSRKNGDLCITFMNEEAGIVNNLDVQNVKALYAYIGDYLYDKEKL